MENISKQFGEMFTTLFEVWGEMFSALLKVIPKAIKAVIWVLCGLIVIPCVFVASEIYPKWLGIYDIK